MKSTVSPKLLQRLPTGIPGLDTVLGGGWFCGGIYMVSGQPGAGKTMFGNQLCFNHVAGGGSAVYVTLLTESHARMLAALQQMTFFDPSHLGKSLSYISAYQELESEGLEGLLALLRRVLRSQKASFLVLDGLVTIGDVAQSDLVLKKFIHELQSLLELIGCTALILTGANTSTSNYPQRTMVDGLVQLNLRQKDMRTVRELEVLKHRGSNHMMGANVYKISDTGISVYPRVEARPLFNGEPISPDSPPLKTGIVGFDKLLGEGVPPGSTTALIGPAGCGKTILGLHFLAAGAAATPKEPGLYFGFFESPARLMAQADRLGLPIRAMADEGLLHFSWQFAQEQIADALLEDLLTTVLEKGIKRVFIDGIDGLRESAIYPNRMNGLVTAMSNALRSRGVTTMLSDEARDLFGGSGIEAPEGGLSASVDNVVLMRYVELQCDVRRVISALKVRGNGQDSRLSELIIRSSGVIVEPNFAHAESLMSGQAHALRMDPRLRQGPGET